MTQIGDQVCFGSHDVGHLSHCIRQFLETCGNIPKGMSHGRKSYAHAFAYAICATAEMSAVSNELLDLFIITNI